MCVSTIHGYGLNEVLTIVEVVSEPFACELPDNEADNAQERNASRDGKTNDCRCARAAAGVIIVIRA